MNSRGRILVVDDCQTNVDILVRILRKEYDLETALDGLECLEKFSSFRPHLVLLDIMMPGLDGYEVCRRIKSSAVGEFVQVVLVSGKGSTPERLRGYEADADDYIVKPFDHDELRSKVRVQFRLWQAQQDLRKANQQLQLHSDDLEMLIEARSRELTSTQDMAVFALAQLAESRDPETGEHLLRIRLYSHMLAQQLASGSKYSHEIDEQFLQDLYRSSPLHDIGKVSIKDAILLKPGRLTTDEFEQMKLHVLSGAETLEVAREHVGHGTFLDMAAHIARYHHERFDGNGYCAGLKGEEIPLAARIVALVDVYDAVTSKRVYKDAIDPLQARQIITEGAGTHFDPVVVEAFLANFDRFVTIGEVRTKDTTCPAPSACSC